jgi:hypothetical protein
MGDSEYDVGCTQTFAVATSHLYLELEAARMFVTDSTACFIWKFSATPLGGITPCRLLAMGRTANRLNLSKQNVSAHK